MQCAYNALFRAAAAVVHAPVLAFVVAVPCFGEPSETRKAFLQRFNCEVATRLSIIRDTPEIKNRFLILSKISDPGSYIQCIFNEPGDILYCEAASGYFKVPEGETWTPILSSERQRALQQLGFDTTVEKGNYAIELKVGSSADLERVGDIILGALFDCYGVTWGTELEVKAPLGQLKGMMSPTCAPAS